MLKKWNYGLAAVIVVATSAAIVPSAWAGCRYQCNYYNNQSINDMANSRTSPNYQSITTDRNGNTYTNGYEVRQRNNYRRIQDEDFEVNNNSNAYNQGYRDGIRNSNRSSASSHKASSHRATTVRTKTKTVNRASSRRHTAVATNRRSTNHHVTTSRTKSRNYASSTRRSNTTNSRSYSSTRNYTNNYTPMRDRAVTYQAAQYGQSIDPRAYMGRGDAWVSGYGQVVRYSAPYRISNINGQRCGWGYAQSSGPRQRTWLCQCATGWRPN